MISREKESTYILDHTTDEASDLHLVGPELIWIFATKSSLSLRFKYNAHPTRDIVAAPAVLVKAANRERH